MRMSLAAVVLALALACAAPRSIAPVPTPDPFILLIHVRAGGVGVPNAVITIAHNGIEHVIRADAHGDRRTAFETMPGRYRVCASSLDYAQACIDLVLDGDADVTVTLHR